MGQVSRLLNGYGPAVPDPPGVAPSEGYCDGKARAPKKLTDWMRQGLLQVRRWLPHRKLLFVADSSYAGPDLLWAMIKADQPDYDGGTRSDGHGPVCACPERKPGTNGRPRKRGLRLPKLTEVAVAPTAGWRRQVAPCWYGEWDRTIKLTSGTALGSNSGQPVVPIRWVMVRDPLGRYKNQALLCTGLATPPEQIVAWFIHGTCRECFGRVAIEARCWPANDRHSPRPP